MQIRELTLLTNDLKATEIFYNQLIGFEIINNSEQQISFKIGTSILVFELTKLSENPKYHFAFTIPNNKITEAFEWLLERTNLITAEDGTLITDFENWKAKAVYFYDNNQNVLELICRTDLQNASNQNFSVESILNISEAGIVSDQPLEIGKQINEKSGSDFFSKGPKREDFAAIGDDNGLFVISNPKRNWYPTDNRAEKWKVKVKFQVAQNEFEMEFN
ncbi:MAG: VOC family protein [Crocinitomicaceae bacterium]|nr:VOC family protein [Crocinitomicaceae bacterium]